MRVLLTRPAYSPLYQLITSKTTQKLVFPPMGLLYIAAALEEEGHRVEIVDGEVDNLAPEGVLQKIEASKPDVVGAGATTVDFEYASSILRQAKKRFGVITLLGGAHGTVLPDQVLDENRHIDYVVRGEGEITVRELLRGIGGSGNLSQVEGISYREEGKVVNNRERSLISNLDNNSWPARHLLDNSKYLFPAPRKGMQVMTSIQTSRGCPYGCIYCYRMFGRSIRFRDPKLVVDEIEDLITRWDVRFISFVDDTFTVDRGRVIEICGQIIRRKLKFSWACLVRADTVEENMLRRMKEAGCEQVSIGVESGNQEVLSRTKKGITLEQCIEAYQLLKKVGFETRGSFMLGLPYENAQTLRNTVDFAKKLQLDRAFFNICTPYPGTPLFDMAKRGEGLSLLTQSWKDFRRWGNAVIELESVSRDELMEWQRVAMMEFYARPKVIFNHVKDFLRGEHAKYYYRPLLFGLAEFYARKIRRAKRPEIAAEKSFP